MNLHKLILQKNACYISGAKMTPAGIMVHSTGANNPNLRRYVGPDDGLLGINQYSNHWNVFHPGGKDIGPHTYVNKNGDGVCDVCGGRQVCVHGFIGKLKDGTIATYQTLPWDAEGWHSGGGSKGSANEMGYIGFEICEDGLTDPAYFNAVYKEAVELCAMLCKQYNLKPEKPTLICHSEGRTLGIASNHGDVMHWFPKHGKSMDTFRADVKAAMGGTATPAPAIPAAPTKSLYRVRRAWTDTKTQKGAFSSLANAQRCADENPGYSVFNAKGVAIYPTGKLGKFIAHLEEEVANGSIYVWGAQGQGKDTISEAWIRSRETSTTNANRAIAFWKKQVAAGYGDRLKAFDCSGLGMAFLQNEEKIVPSDMNANGMLGKCERITKAQCCRGDWVFVCNSSGRATHIGYIVDDALNVIEAKGRDAGVVKRPMSKGSWNTYGRPRYFADEIQPTAKTPTALPYKVKVTANTLNIRKGPGTNYGKNGSIRDKGTYTIVEESDGKGSTAGWGKLKSGAGWISLDYCKKL